MGRIRGVFSGYTSLKRSSRYVFSCLLGLLGNLHSKAEIGFKGTQDLRNRVPQAQSATRRTYNTNIQFIVCEPEESPARLQQMVDVSRAFYESLEIPYRVVNIVSGGLNNAASIKYDLEAWFPYQGEYKELVSCSNCTDYQSRSLNVKLGYKSKDAKPGYVHMLNGTLCATERALCCIVENYQTPDVSFTFQVLHRRWRGMRVVSLLRPKIL